MSDSEIVERFDRVARASPDRLVVHAPSGDRHITAGTLAASGRELSRALGAAGLGPDDLVLSALGNHDAFFSLLLACAGRGVAVLPLDRGTPPAEALPLAVRFGATAIVVRDDSLDHAGATGRDLPGGLRLLRLGTPARTIATRGAALLKMTSGSTGLPKATFTTASNLIADSEAIIEAMDIRPDDTQVACIPLSHAYALGNIVGPLFLQGTTAVLHDQFAPGHFVQDARRFRTRVFAGVPFMFEHLAAHLPAEDWPPALEKLITAGARLEVSTARRFVAQFGVRIHNLYGSSETGGITFDQVADPDDMASVGTPLPRVTLSLRPDAAAPAGAGRVHVAGPAVCRGYADAQEEADSPFDAGGFLTGDLGALDARGRLEIVGRVSSFINIAGRKVQPDEVERVLSAMPGIAEARVIGIADAVRGQQLVACIVPRDHDLRPIAIRHYCADRLAAYKIPRAFLFLDALPRDARGKTNRHALDALARGRLTGSSG